MIPPTKKQRAEPPEAILSMWRKRIEMAKGVEVRYGLPPGSFDDFDNYLGHSNTATTCCTEPPTVDSIIDTVREFNAKFTMRPVDVVVMTDAQFMQLRNHLEVKEPVQLAPFSVWPERLLGIPIETYGTITEVYARAEELRDDGKSVMTVDFGKED